MYFLRALLCPKKHYSREEKSDSIVWLSSHCTIVFGTLLERKDINIDRFWVLDPYVCCQKIKTRWAWKEMINKNLEQFAKTRWVVIRGSVKYQRFSKNWNMQSFKVLWGLGQLVILNDSWLMSLAVRSSCNVKENICRDIVWLLCYLRFAIFIYVIMLGLSRHRR
jgi:hypothetical protein